MNAQSRLGYAFLFLGFVMIVFAVVQLVFVFTGTISPVSLFEFQASDFAIDGEVLFPQLPSSLTNDMKVELFPVELINSGFNIGANCIFMSLIIFAGSRIAGIGTQLVRSIEVKLKTNE